MPPMQRIELTREIPAPPQAVWDVFTAHEDWSNWAGIAEVVLRQEGYPPPNGLGAIRIVRQSGLAVEEEITAFEPPKRMAYRLTAGAPLRDHHGEVSFEPHESGTRLTWRVEFRPWIPGTGFLVRRALERTLRGVLTRLAAYPFASPGA